MRGTSLGVALIIVSVVAGNPTDLHTVKKRVGNLPVIPGDDDANSLGLLKYKKWRVNQNQDKPQQDKRFYAPQQTVSQFHSSDSTYSNINGNVHKQQEERGQANENGHLVGSFHRSGSEEAHPGQEPHTQELSEFDVPGMNIHEKMLEQDGQLFDLNRGEKDGQLFDLNQQGEGEPANLQKREDIDEELVLQVASVLAGYIQQTGDEEGVAQYINQMIIKGEMKSSEALVYLNTIKELLAREDEIERENETEEEAERETEAELMLSFSDYLDRKYETGQMSRSVYRELKDKLMESVLEKAEVDPKFLANPDNSIF